MAKKQDEPKTYEEKVEFARKQVKKFERARLAFLKPGKSLESITEQANVAWKNYQSLLKAKPA